MPCEVVICGGGVAALEAAGAVREYAGNRARVMLIASEADSSTARSRRL